MIEERSLIMKQDVVVKLIGRRDDIPESVLNEIDKTVEMSSTNGGTRLCLAVNYGGRSEIVDAVQRIATQVAKGKMDASEVSERTISDSLYTAGMPDPDLLIRTAGEMRVSNFLLWQISYAELWVTEKCWPEFEIKDLHQAMQDFAARDRRYGGLNIND